MFDGFDARIDVIWKFFDPDTVPEKYFDWLAAWLQLPMDPLWDLSKKRAMLKKAVLDYSKRGTPDGIRQALKDRVDVPGEFAVLEHFRLRQWPLLNVSGPVCGGTRLWSRDFYQRLQVGGGSQVGNFRLANKPEPAAEATNWGANEFSVFFPVSPYDDPDALAGKISAVVDQEKPAHTKADCVPVLPRFRVGVQATLGVDSSVGVCSRMALRSLSTLGYDTILSCSPAQSDVENMGASVRPVAGVSTRLL